MTSGSDRERWDRIVTIFEQALEVTGPARGDLLDRVCGADQAVRREVEEMLAADGRGGGLMDDSWPGGAGDAPLAGVLAQGSRVGSYRIVSLIGAGGMGDVYRAERADGAYRQAVALKVLRPGYQTAELIRRFRVEREALARLVHPGIARILDGGTLDDGRPYIVLELVDGRAITAYCEQGGLSLRERLALFLKVAGTVQFAHGRLVIHRDIKPSNILVQADGTPRLLDFGIAKLLDLDTAPSLAISTTPEVRLLTPEYAAPEQIKGEPPGTATDVYALGTLLYEMLTRRKPFPAAGRTRAELEWAILQTPAPTPSSVAGSRSLARALRGDLDRIVLMALRKEPDRRYLSAGQLGEDVERWLAGRPVLARPDSVRYRAAKFVARNRALVAGGVALAVLLAGFGITATVEARRFARERDRAERERTAADDVLGILTGLFERADPNKHPGGDTLRVASLLDDAEREIEGLSHDPARQSALLRAVAQMRAAHGEYPKAIEFLTEAYDRRREVFGPHDVEAARIRHDLGVAVFSYHGNEAARPILDSSLTELRRLLGEEHEEVREAMGDLLATLSDSSEARALLDRLLDLERRAPSQDPVAIASRLDTQGAARYGAGQYGEAAAMFEASLGLLQKRLPPTHQYIRTERQNLAMALLGQGLVVRAESLQRVAIEVEDRIDGPAATRAMAREALALTFARAGRADSAERYEREALALFRQGTAPGHWRVWSAQRNLAFINVARGRISDGLLLLDSAIALASAAPDSGEAAAYLTAQRVPMLLRLDRTAEARRSIEEAERRLGARPSVSAAHRADVHRYAAMVRIAAGDAGRAVERLRQAVALAEPPDRAQTVPGINSCLLGVALARLGRTGEAQGLLAGACTAYEAQGMADPLILAWITAARPAGGGPR